MSTSAYAMKDGKAPADEPVIHRIRITLTSRNVKSLEKGIAIDYITLLTNHNWLLLFALC